MSQDIDKKYISPIDEFLRAFDKTHNKSLSQKKEIAKHERIANLRDNPDANHPDKAIWEDF